MITGFMPPPDAVDMHGVGHVLVIKFRNIGDVLLASPVISVLNRELPEQSFIDVMVYADTAPMLSGNSSVNNIYCVDRAECGISSIWHFVKQLISVRHKKYDLIINLTEGDRGAIVSLFSGANTRVGLEHEKNARKWWKRKSYTHFYRTNIRKRHIVEQGLDAVRRIGVGVPYESEPLVVAYSNNDIKSMQKKLRKLNWKDQPYVVVHPVSRWFYKCLRTTQIATMIEELSSHDLQIVLTSGSDHREREMLRQISSICLVRVIDVGGKLNLKELAALIKGAKMSVSTDTMASHMSAAVGTPVFSWFGPSREKVWRPWMVKYHIISSNYPCSPCGYDGCGGGKISECLNGITDERIRYEINNFMKELEL